MKLAVLGLGAMGWNHVRVAHELGMLGAVADVVPEACARAAKTFGIPSHQEAAKAIAAADAVVIATPTASHARLALDAIGAGKHVLVEKPLAASIAEGRRIIDAARAAGVTLAVGHIERHNPVVAYAKSQLGGPDLGDLVAMAGRRVSTFPARIRDVGCIFDIGIHEIDVANYLVGSEVEHVHALAGSYRAGGREDHALIHLRFRNGRSASIEASWLAPQRIRRNAVTCARGMIEIDYMAQSARISRLTAVDPIPPTSGVPAVELEVREVLLRREEPLRNELADFVSAAQARRPPLVSGEDGLTALAVAEAALRSAKEARSVGVDAES